MNLMTSLPPEVLGMVQLYLDQVGISRLCRTCWAISVQPDAWQACESRRGDSLRWLWTVATCDSDAPHNMTRDAVDVTGSRYAVAVLTPRGVSVATPSFQRWRSIEHGVSVALSPDSKVVCVGTSEGWVMLMAENTVIEVPVGSSARVRTDGASGFFVVSDGKVWHVYHRDVGTSHEATHVTITYDQPWAATCACRLRSGSVLVGTKRGVYHLGNRGFVTCVHAVDVASAATCVAVAQANKELHLLCPRTWETLHVLYSKNNATYTRVHVHNDLIVWGEYTVNTSTCVVYTASPTRRGVATCRDMACCIARDGTVRGVSRNEGWV